MSEQTRTGLAPRTRGIHDWERDRRATWLELFIDLVFVVAIARLGALLHDDHSAQGVAVFAGLFVAIWWLWISFSYFADLFDDDGPAHRVAQLLAALGAAALAVTLTEDFGHNSDRFAAIYASLFVLLAAMYAAAGRVEPRAAELCRWYLAGSMLGAALWAVSVLAPTPARYWIWAIAIAANAAISGPLAYARMREPPHQTSHMPERFGLFTILVLGEAMWSTVNGIAVSDWNPAAVVVSVAGFVIAAGVWWVYFGGFDESAINRALAGGRAAQVRSFLYGYGHLLIYAAIVATGIGIEIAAEQAAHGEEERLVLFGMAQFAIIIGFIVISSGVGLAGGFGPAARRILLSIKLAIGLGALALGLVDASPALVVALVAAGWTVLVIAEVTLQAQPRRRAEGRERAVA